MPASLTLPMEEWLSTSPNSHNDADGSMPLPPDRRRHHHSVASEVLALGGREAVGVLRDSVSP
jgi:hypothetical protein